MKKRDLAIKLARSFFVMKVQQFVKNILNLHNYKQTIYNHPI